MHVTRIADAPAYEAPNHFDMRCLRLQGKEAGPSTQMWMGMSELSPGGRTGLDESPMEKLYLVLEGELQMIGEVDGRREEHTLRPRDSCRFAPGEKRQLWNRSDRRAVVVLVMPTSPPVQAQRHEGAER